MILACIAAVSENGVIGRAGGLPWRLPADLKRFRELTTGHAILMGRKTFESIGRLLPDRRTIVVSRNPALAEPGARVARSLEEALELAATEDPDEEAFVIGGQAIFELALARANRLYLTLVHATVEGDVFLPPRALEGFELVKDEFHPPDAKNALPFSFRLYERKSTVDS
jgi:dihydrofolate reductase